MHGIKNTITHSFHPFFIIPSIKYASPHCRWIIWPISCGNLTCGSSYLSLAIEGLWCAYKGSTYVCMVTTFSKISANWYHKIITYETNNYFVEYLHKPNTQSNAFSFACLLWPCSQHVLQMGPLHWGHPYTELLELDCFNSLLRELELFLWQIRQ